MATDRLTPLQRRVLRVLAKLDPQWTLTGGGALAGVHLGHRGTRESTPAIDPPQRREIDGASISVDSMHEILVAKLTALLGRTELRDLIDVQALLEAGCDLRTALRDAPKKDGGFSALTLAWVLESFDPRPLARSLGLSDEDVAHLTAFKRELIGELTRIARPTSSDA